MVALRLFLSIALFLGLSHASSIPHGLDALSQKDFNVSRGLNYHYYSTPPGDADKPYLIFLHGWPSSAHDWRYQIDYFSTRGFGIIVPDMLGYGGTAKPLEAEAYKSSLVTRDIVDILEHEQVQGVIAVGHDWGAKVAGRLANYYEDRFLGFALYAVGYLLPGPFIFQEFEAQSKAAVGYDQWGFWDFLSSDNASEIIQANPDSLWLLGFSLDPRLSIPHFSPRGALQGWLEAGSRTETFLSKKEYDTGKKAFFSSGVTASLNWFKTMTSDIESLDDQGIPLSAYNITKPVFYGGGSRDYICVPATQRASLFGYVSNYTFQDYDGGHWLFLQQPQEVNKDLLEWIEGIIKD